MEALADPEQALQGLVTVLDSIHLSAETVTSTLLQKLLLRDDVSVLVVTSRHSTPHYTLLLRRLNLNVSKIGSEGRFRVLNTNSLCRLDVDADRYSFDVDALMKAVVSDVRSLAGAGHPSPSSCPRRCAVLFDDFFTLLNSTRQHPLTVSRAIAGLSPVTFCRVVVVHEDVEDLDWVVTTLSCEAATIVRPLPPVSGSTAEYGAQMNVLQRKFRQESPASALNSGR